MAYVDTMVSLLNYLYTRLTSDESLQVAMGGTVRLYPVQAAPDTTMPFLIHRIDPAPIPASDGFFPMRQATYQLDIWSDSDNVSEAMSVRQKVLTLLDELDFSTDEVKGARLWTQTEGFIPDPETGIFHYTIQMNLRYYRVGEAAGILGR